jgi:TAP-like protein
VIRIPAKAQSPKPLLTNPGGPGISGVNDLRANREYFEKFSDAYTVVSFDPRGVGASVPAVQCLDDQQWQAIFNQPSHGLRPDRNGAGPVLILNTAGGPATPLAWAQSLHGQIKNWTLVVAPAQGHIASSQNACAEDTLTAFLKKGALPPDRVFNCPPNA